MSGPSEIAATLARDGRENLPDRGAATAAKATAVVFTSRPAPRRWRANNHPPGPLAAARWRSFLPTFCPTTIESLTATIGDRAPDLVLHS